MFGGFKDVVQDLPWAISKVLKLIGNWSAIHIQCAYTGYLSYYLDMYNWVFGK